MQLFYTVPLPLKHKLLNGCGKKYLLEMRSSHKSYIDCYLCCFMLKTYPAPTVPCQMKHCDLQEF